MNAITRSLPLALLFAVAGAVRGATADSSLAPDSWPAGASPRDIGRRLVERFIPSAHTNFNRPEAATYITYPEVCTWYGALTFASVTQDRELEAKLIRRFEPLLGPAESALVPDREHVDYEVFGIVPLQIFRANHDERCLKLGLAKADRQWQHPDAAGLSPQTRYWIDDMYMITALQVQAARATGNHAYLDRAAREMVDYLEKLQQPNGLFFHAKESPFFWGRGNGWVAAGMAELLRDLPTDHPARATVLAAYRKMMESLLRAQDPQGMWHQLIDRPDSWPESSSTAMFTFAMVTGVKSGWLEPDRFAPAARKAWLALVAHIDGDGAVHDVCEGTNKGPTVEYYMTRRRFVGDPHGQAPVLWTATALLR